MENLKYIIIGIVILVIASVIWFGLTFKPGSYPYAELYKINTAEESLINAVQIFKTKNPDFDIPKQLGIKDGKRNNTDHWYHIYFYYPQQNEIVKCWIRTSTANQTTFAFVAINEGVNIGNWRFINKDFTTIENDNQKEKFETLILNKIKAEL